MNGKTFDLWSVVHFASGALLGWSGLGMCTVLLILTAFEVFESMLRAVGPAGEGLFEHESPRNILADLLIGALGFYCARLARSFRE